MKDLEQHCFEKEAGPLLNAITGLAGKSLQGLGTLAYKGAIKPSAQLMYYGGLKPGAKLLYHGSKYPLRAGGSLIGNVLVKPPLHMLGKSFADAPLSSLGKAALADRILPYSLELASLNRIRGRSPVTYSSAENFGRPFDPLPMGLMKEGGEKNMTQYRMKHLEKYAAQSWKSYLTDPKTLGLIGATGMLTSLMSPTLSTMGRKIERSFFPVEDRVGVEDELLKQKLRHLAENQAQQEIKKIEEKEHQQVNVPAIQGVVSNLVKQDPVINHAYSNPKIRPIIDQTTNAITTFAPSVAKDPRAMQSVLTEAISSPEGGLSYQTIRSLAETQRLMNQ